MNFKHRIRQQFSRAAADYDQAAHLQSQCIEDLSLMLPAIQGKHILDLGCGTGQALTVLQHQYPQALYYGLDLSESMLSIAQQKASHPSLINADFDAIPLAQKSIDLIFSNLALQWSPDLHLSLQEAKRILKLNGHLIFSSLTQGSLTELKATHFLTHTSVISALNQNGFMINTALQKKMRFYFSSVKKALLSLKEIGANACDTPHHQGLNARSRIQELEAHYPHDQKGYPLSYEILLISAQKIS
ncbi:MAG: methyltransferase domain-containing protein [Gammaproteobacteria bacterium]|nr:methyltransferase domain-containing protein [Gammaproteobacteria bacterium]